MKEEIRVKHNDIQKIADELGYSRNHVSVCLRGIVDSDASEKIRKKALKMGGVKVKNRK